MTDDFISPNDVQEIVRNERRIAIDQLGPTPNEVALGLGLDHPALTHDVVDGSADPTTGGLKPSNDD